MSSRDLLRHALWRANGEDLRSDFIREGSRACLDELDAGDGMRRAANQHGLYHPTGLQRAHGFLGSRVARFGKEDAPRCCRGARVQ